MALSARNEETEIVSEDMQRINDNAAMPSEEGIELILADQERNLPEGKDYHLFFAYSSEDATFVRQKVKTLERPPYNLKCCFNDRDFTPGVPIHENIEILMPKCVKVVLVLTPDFYASGWCRHEERIAHALSANNGMGVIPLVHKACQITDSLKTLNYIDETRANVADDKIVEAVFSEARPSNSLSDWLNPRNDVNGAGIMLEPDRKRNNSGKMRAVTKHDVNILRNMGADVDLDDLVPLIHSVNNHLSKMFYGLLPCTRHIYVYKGFFMFGFVMFVIASVLMVIGGTLTLAVVVEIAIGPMVTGIITIFCLLFIMHRVTKTERDINDTLAKKNLILYRKAKVIVSFRVDPFPKVAVLYYDTNACKNYILNDLKNAVDPGCEQDPAINVIEVFVDKFIDTLVSKFTPKFAKWEEFASANNLRHRTKQDKMCLCEMYDSGIACLDKTKILLALQERS